MARRITVKVIRNDIRKEGARISRNLERRVPHVASDMRDDLAEAVLGGGLPLQPDTGALGQSLAVQTAQGSDFSEKRDNAKSAYLNNDSRYRDAVREDISPNAYTEQHFENRAAVDEPPLSQEQHTYRAAILTMLYWGLLWEYGHYNEFTGKAEHRPWFAPFLENWFAQNAVNAFEGLAN